MKQQLTHGFIEIISLENLFAAWGEFAKGKLKKRDVQEFSLTLADNIIQLNTELANRTYTHGKYVNFKLSDPKPRHIHKAEVRDRILHHAIYRILYPFFETVFTADSYSCRLNKGTHKAMNRFQSFAYKASRNHTRTVWVLQCDIQKFFASINHEILLGVLRRYIQDEDTMWLLREVIKSFPEHPQKGLPLGNLTSQLFCNVYMNEFDQFVKHKLRVKYYVRYADDFVLLSEDRKLLYEQIPKISNFLHSKLKLSLHPNKVHITTLASGVDFLGWVHFPNHRVLRTITRRRMLGRLQIHPTSQTLQSYLGLLQHGNAYELKQELLNIHGLWGEKV